MHAAFLAAITAAPDDDLPRLVYADWLDEHGQPERAEFIRTQIELANLSPTDPRREGLKARERFLLREHKEGWQMAEFRGRSQMFRRGFAELVNVRADWLLDHPQALNAPGPLRAMRVFNATARIHHMAEVSGLARLETLDLSNTNFAGEEDVRAFFTTARLDRLRELVLRNSNFVEAEELDALAGTPVAPRLRELDVSGSRIGTRGVRTLAGRQEFGGLRVLKLRADELERHSCIDTDGALVLADSQVLSGLRSLDLSDHYIADVGLRRLAWSPNAVHLERLAVEYNEIGVGDEGIVAVVASPRLGNLKELWFGGNQLGPLGAEALANWPHLERMILVDLQECPLSPAVRETLARSRWADRFVL